jgi:hypothetical protein
MTRYFLHLRDGTDEIVDPDGHVFDDEGQLRKAVVDNARDILCGEIRSEGLIDLRPRIDAEDEAGNIVYSLPFADAVSIIRES